MIPGECNVTTTKATYFGFFIRFNLALGLFRKKGNVWCEFLWVLSLLYPLRFADISQKNFSKFFSFVFYSFFPYLLFHQIKQILLRIYLKYFGKKETNKPTKQNNKKLIRFISPALPCRLPNSSLFICASFFFYLTQSKEGKSLNFLSLLNDVIFSRAHSDLNHKIKVPITTTGRSLLINAKKFRITYLNQMESWVHRKIVFLSAPHNKNSMFKLKLINTVSHSPECCTWNNRIILQSNK